MIKRYSILVAILGLAHVSYGQQYTNYFTEQLGPIDWKFLSDSVAPNVPEYLFSHDNESEEYKKVVVDWIYGHPAEFDAAKMIDARLHAYVQWAAKANGINKGDGPYGNPSFVYYPVNENKPVFVDIQNPDQDSLVYNNKLQNWYFQFDKGEYEKRYGGLPEVLPYPQPIMHPNDFPKEYGKSNFEWYYPEFSDDPNVLKQYFEQYKKQYGASDKSPDK